MPSSASTLRGRLDRRRRQLELAGDRRAGSWARRKARTAQRRYLRAHWRLLLLAALALLAPIAVAALLVPSTAARFFLLGAGVAGVAGALTLWVLQVTGTAPTMMGDLAEQWTASELRGLRRKGWRLVNQLALRPWDIDHVLIGPGGAVVVETKWTATTWQLDPPDDRVRRAVEQARSNARDLRLWGPWRAAGVTDVRPVVMLWGTGSNQLETIDLDGVAVVPGPAAQAWLEQLPSHGVSADQVDHAWALLEQQTRMRDSRDEPMPPSALSLAGAGLAIITAGAAAFLIAASLLAPIGSWLGWTLTCLALAAVAQPLRRRPLTRLPALAWQTGLIAMLAVAGLAVALQQ